MAKSLVSAQPQFLFIKFLWKVHYVKILRVKKTLWCSFQQSFRLLIRFILCMLIYIRKATATLYFYWYLWGSIQQHSSKISKSLPSIFILQQFHKENLFLKFHFLYLQAEILCTTEEIGSDEVRYLYWLLITWMKKSRF